MIFGAATMLGGIVGVSLGSAMSWAMKRFWIQTPRSDAVVCALGPMLSFPTLFVTMLLIHGKLAVAYVVMFVSITCLCMNWAVNVDLLMVRETPLFIASERGEHIKAQRGNVMANVFGTRHWYGAWPVHHWPCKPTNSTTQNRRYPTLSEVLPTHRKHILTH